MAKNPQPGEYWLTPFEPHGLVKVLEVHPKDDVKHVPWVTVEYAHSHSGYEAGTTGSYYVFELRALTPGLLALLAHADALAAANARLRNDLAIIEQGCNSPWMTGAAFKDRVADIFASRALLDGADTPGEGGA